MKAIAWLLFVSGTLLAAACGARIEPLWVPFAVGVVLCIAGAVLLRRAQDPAGSVAEEDGGIVDLPTLGRRFASMVEAIDHARSLEGEALKAAVEDVLLERFLPIVDARLLIAAEHGVEGYARVFTPAASGERCLNRAWSMLVDGSGDPGAQVHAAEEHFRRALHAWPGGAPTDGSAVPGVGPDGALKQKPD